MCVLFAAPLHTLTFEEADGRISVPFSQKEEAHKLWGQPSTFAEVAELFAGYCMGSVSALPWSEQPPAKETNIISESLAQLNKQGYLTINSQPAVDGADSSDPTHGWGPRYGYVYQKVGATSKTNAVSSSLADAFTLLFRPTSSSSAPQRTSKRFSPDCHQTRPSLITL